MARFRYLTVGMLIAAVTLAGNLAGAAPAAAAPPVAQSCPVRFWVVGPEDSLTSIALAVYGDGNKWEIIYAANRALIGPDPNLIIDGTRLVVPLGKWPCPPAPKPTPQPKPKPSGPPTAGRPALGAFYVVKAGDSLASIARAAFGNEAQWPKLYDANVRVIGPVPIAQVGQRLFIPAPGGAPSRPGTQLFSYTVRAGDSLTSLAQTYLGNGARWPEIYDLNRGVIGATPILQVGQRLRIPVTAAGAPAIPAGSVARQPAAKPVQPANPKPTPPPTPKPTVFMYTVNAGDTLASIAVRYYGDSMRLLDIYAANRATIGPDPEGIKPGMQLVLPGIAP
jgi:nucleoid-associated protein YgaU